MRVLDRALWQFSKETQRAEEAATLQALAEIDSMLVPDAQELRDDGDDEG